MARSSLLHDHSRGYRLRAFVGETGTWVQRHGEWQRPMHVWLYRGAWRIICWPCMTSLRSDDALYDGGWRTLTAAFDVAWDHCRTCPDNPPL